jgi:hypothetical protein
VRPSIDSGGPRPRALANVHTTDAVLRSWISDGRVRGLGRFEERDIQGLIPRTSLGYINVSDWIKSGSNSMDVEVSGGKTHRKRSETVVWIFLVCLFVHPSQLLILNYC